MRLSFLSIAAIGLAALLIRGSAGAQINPGNAAGGTDQAENPSQKADYDRAEEVLSRHRTELVRVPHVNSVSVSNEENGVDPVIAVWVIDPKNVDAVERAVPDSLEGFPVEVRVADRGIAL
ncbi:MAG: hypothetical protein ACYDC3_13765 [Candidatus Binataceae bacterium]